MGENSKIGSNAVVLNSVPADSTVVGVPAREVLFNRMIPKKLTTIILRHMVFHHRQTIQLRFD